VMTIKLVALIYLNIEYVNVKLHHDQGSD
jgi:hypothetical protein